LLIHINKNFNQIAMAELLILLVLLLPQTIAGIFARSQGRSFWFWFFISFLIPVISLIVLLFLEDKSDGDTSFGVSEDVKERKRAALNHNQDR